VDRLPAGENVPVVRTDFSSDAAWDALCAAVRTPEPTDGFLPNVDFISDPSFDGFTTDQVIRLARAGDSRSFVLIADAQTFRHPERPILVVDLFDETYPTFRAVPATIWNVENNLSLGNADFEDYVRECGDDGIFRPG
jgi:hypothetical protein